MPVLIAAAILFGSTNHEAQAVVIREDASLAETLVLGSSYEMTVVVGGGSGTLIAPRWVLTAAHVARGLSPLAPFVQIRSERVRVRSIVLHPEAVSNRPGPPQVDLALLHLETSIDDVDPALLYRGDQEISSNVVVVGYGDFGTPGTRLTFTDGRRRAANNRVADVTTRHVVLHFDQPPAGEPLEGVGAPGDSGGSLYLADTQPPLLLGVSSASRGARPGQYGLDDLYVRVSRHVDWIDSAMASPPQESNLPSPTDISAAGMPNTDAGRLAEQFLAAYNTAEHDRLVAFSAKHRLPGARRDRPDVSWARQMIDWKQRHGAFHPRHYISTPTSFEILVETDPGGERRILRFRLQQRGGRTYLDGQRLLQA